MIITISLNHHHRFGITQLISMSNHYNIDFNLNVEITGSYQQNLEL